MSVGLFFLSSVIAHGSTSALRNINEEFFVDEPETEVFQYLIRHLDQYSEIASADAVFESTGVNIPEVEDSVDYHRERLFERKFHNDIMDPYNALRDALADRHTPEAREAIQSLTAAAMAGRSTQELLSLSGVGDAMMEAYTRHHQSPGLTGIPTGWPRLDRDTGGYQDGDLNVWIARPGVGKTWLMLWQMRAAVVAGHSTLFVSMEMPLEQIAARYYGMVAGIDVRMIRRGQLSSRTAARLARTVREQDVISNRVHFWAGNMGQTTTELNATAAELNPDIVYVDGVYLLNSRRAPKNTDRNSRVAFAIDDLKRLALTRSIPIIASSQFNRAAGRGGRAGNLETIGFTDAFGQNTSLVYTIKQAHTRAASPNSLLVTTEKGREGEHAEMAVAFEFHPVNFEEIALTEVQDPRRQEVELGWMH